MFKLLTNDTTVLTKITLLPTKMADSGQVKNSKLQFKKGYCTKNESPQQVGL